MKLTQSIRGDTTRRPAKAVKALGVGCALTGSCYLILLASKNPSKELLFALAMEGIFLLGWLALRLAASRRKSVQLKNLVVEEVMWQFRPLQLARTSLMSLAALTLGLLLITMLTDLSALLAADFRAFGYARAVYRALPTYRLYEGAHPAFSLEVLSGACIEAGRYEEAHVYTEQLLRIREEIYGKNHWMYGGMVANLGGLLYREGRFADAEKAYRESVRICTNARGYRTLGSALTRLGNSLREQGRSDEARIFYDKALAMRTREFGPDSLRVAETTREMALLMRRAGKRKESARLLAKATEIIRSDTGKHPADTIPLILWVTLSMAASYCLFSRNGLLTRLVIRRLEERVTRAGAAADASDVEQLLKLLELRGDQKRIDQVKSSGLGLLLVGSISAFTEQA